MKKILFLIIAILFSGCSQQSFFAPTQKATPSVTPTRTLVPTRTFVPIHTPDPLAPYQGALPQIPDGFTWKMNPELDTIFLMPDGWFFNTEYCPMINFYETNVIDLSDIGQTCISQENPFEVGKYSTGQAVIVYKDIEDAEGFAQYILYILATSPNFGLLSIGSQEDALKFLKKFPTEIYMKDVHQTTQVINSWQYKTDTYTVYHLRVEADYLNETSGNKKKIVQYSAIPVKDRMYLMVFETPYDQWEKIMGKYSLLLDYLMIVYQ